jgi:hypothetical protein
MKKYFFIAMAILIISINFILKFYQEDKIKKELVLLQKQNIEFKYKDLNCGSMFSKTCSLSNIDVYYFNKPLLKINSLVFNKLEKNNFKMNGITGYDFTIYKHMFPMDIKLKQNKVNLNNNYLKMDILLKYKSSLESIEVDLKNKDILTLFFKLYKSTISSLNKEQRRIYNTDFLNYKSSEILSKKDFNAKLWIVLNIFMNESVHVDTKENVELIKNVIDFIQNNGSRLYVNIGFKDKTQPSDLLTKQIAVIKTLKSKFKKEGR